MKRGKFIVLEGGEGSGTTTMLSRIAETFAVDTYISTREPGGSPYAEEIRNVILHGDHAKDADPTTMLLLFTAARVEHMKKVILPALASGKHVLCDRFEPSTHVYQIIAEDKPELLPTLKNLWNEFLKGCEPDLCIVLDVDPKTGLSRVERRGGKKTHFDERSLA